MTAIDIAGMPASEELKLMEALWAFLSVEAEGSLVSPSWHESALQDAEKQFAAGTARLVDWNAAKPRLRGRGQA